ncbi:hypothetical protein HJFPF1_04110 [Paramyrothecium foliicola]|nr:hypothetical protein HJFPF1_04110 [Paramyrothecium foliicola]
MNLFDEAMISLRPPSHTKLPPPAEYQDPKATFFGIGAWWTVFSTFPLSKYQRKPPRTGQFVIEFDLAAKTYNHKEFWLDLTVEAPRGQYYPPPQTISRPGKLVEPGAHEPLEESSLKKLMSRLHHRWSKDKPTTTAAAPDPDQRVSTFREDETGRQWEIICWGKQGQLSEWMVDDNDGWISDSAGERRADWRRMYVVVYYHATANAECGIEVWESVGSGSKLTDETFGKIQDAIRRVEDPAFAGLAERLADVVSQ